MYKNPASERGMNIAAKLKAIRESLPQKLTVREVAAHMGKPETPNAYGYYEGKDFKRKSLPLDKAQEIAGIFARHGGDPEEVLALAGLSGPDLSSEAEAIVDSSPRITFITMPVAVPNVEMLTAMMRGLLISVGLDDAAAEHSETLARRLPGALEQAAKAIAPAPSVRSPIADERSPSRAKRDRG